MKPAERVQGVDRLERVRITYEREAVLASRRIIGNEDRSLSHAVRAREEADLDGARLARRQRAREGIAVVGLGEIRAGSR